MFVGALQVCLVALCGSFQESGSFRAGIAFVEKMQMKALSLKACALQTFQSVS